jgi:hypothetical protein
VGDTMPRLGHSRLFWMVVLLALVVGLAWPATHPRAVRSLAQPSLADGVLDNPHLSGGPHHVRHTGPSAHSSTLGSARELREAPPEEDTTVAMRIVERATGVPVADAIAYPAGRENRGSQSSIYFPHGLPTDLEALGSPLKSDATGRVVLHTSDGSWHGYVWAAGYAWREVALNPGTASIVIELEPGGGLSLTVRNWPLLQHASVVVRYGDGQVVKLPTLSPRGDLLVHGLRCGENTLIIRRDSKWATGVQYASVPFSLAQRSIAEIVVDPDLARVPELCKLHGVLVIDESWSEEREQPVTLTLQGRDSTNSDISESLLLEDVSFGVPLPFGTERPVPPGLYHVEIAPFGYQADIRFDGTTLPVPIHVSGRTAVCIRLDVMGGRTIRNAVLKWRRVRDAGFDAGGTVESVPYQAESQSFTFSCPPGRLKIWVDAPGFRLRDGKYTDISVESGVTRTHVLTIEPAGVLAVEVKCGGAPVDADVMVCPLPQEVGPSVLTRQGVAHFSDLAAGKYLIVATVPDEYFEPNPRRVEVQVGAPAHVVIELKARAR